MKNRIARHSRSLLRSILVAGGVLLPWFFGGEVPEVEIAVAAATAVALVCGLVWLLTTEEPVRLPPSLAWLVLVGAVLGGLQAVRVPARVLKMVSPHALQIQCELASSAGAQSDRAADDAASSETDAAPLANESDTAVSFYPASTRRSAEWLGICAALVLLAALAFHDLESARWLLFAIALNGAAISVFGLTQQLRWSGKIYWWFPLPLDGGTPFGPYVNRNHASGFLNLCFAAAVGALYWNWARRRHDERVSAFLKSSGARLPLVARLRRGIADLNAPKLVLLAVVLFVLAGIASSLSRGGTLAMLAAVIAVIMLLLFRRTYWALTGFAVVLGGMFFLAWLGRLDPVRERLGTLNDPSAAGAGRVDLWQDSLGLVPDFWATGTGIGTYRFVYAMKQDRASDVWNHHAESHYVETLVEAGIPGLALILTAIVLVLTASVRLLGMQRCSQRAVGLAGVFVLVSQMVAGAFDFGLCLPANSILLSILCGVIVGLARPETSTKSQDAGTIPRRAPIVVTGCYMGLALVGASAGVYEYQAPRLRTEVERRFFEDAKSDREWSVQQMVAVRGLIEKAIAFTPDDAEAHLKLAVWHVHEFRRAATDALMNNDGAFADRAEAWPYTSLDETHRLARSLERLGLTDELRELRSSDPVRNHLKLAAEQFRLALRDCPLLARAHYHLAQLDAVVGDGTRETEHLRHAMRVEPARSNLAYGVGLLALNSGQVDECRKYWHHSLELSKQYESLILPMARQVTALRESLEQLVPDDALRRLEIAQRYLSEPAYRAERDELLHLVIEQATASSDGTPEQLYASASAHHLLGSLEEAVIQFERALEIAPSEVGWRAEYADTLHLQGKLDEAIKQYQVCEYQSGNRGIYQRQIDTLRQERTQRRREQLLRRPPLP